MKPLLRDGSSKFCKRVSTGRVDGHMGVLAHSCNLSWRHGSYTSNESRSSLLCIRPIERLGRLSDLIQARVLKKCFPTLARHGALCEFDRARATVDNL